MLSKIRERLTAIWPFSSILRIWEANKGRFIIVLAIGAFKKFTADDATHMAAGIAYYGFVSLFPLILGLIAILGIFLTSSETQTNVLEFVTDSLPGSDELVSDNIESILRFRGSLGAIAIIGLIWSGSAIFGGVNKALNRAWSVEKRASFVKAKAKHLSMAVGSALLFVISTGLVALSQFSEHLEDANSAFGFMTGLVMQVVFQLIALGFTIGIFLFLYKYMPHTKTEWRHIWPGAVLAGILFEILKSLFVFYVEHFTSFSNVYGSIAPIIVLLVWMYFSAMILLLGAELSSEYGRLKRAEKANL